MIAMDNDRPTPVPMADEEDDATEVWRGQVLPPPPNGEPPPPSGVVTAPSSKAPEFVAVERPSVVPMVRDTIVDPPPSLWERITTGARRFGAAFQSDFFGTDAPISPELPTLVSGNLSSEDWHGELMLIALVRAPRRYQRAAIEVARRALGVRRYGDDAYAEFVVHFALSRMRPDNQGRIGIAQVIDGLPFLGFSATIAPALRRLEERRVLLLVLDTSGGDPMTILLREKVTHIELRILV